MTTPGPAHRVQSAVVEYGFPQGHLGHLTATEESAFEKFKVACQAKGYYTPATDAAPASHDDALMLRFLRARRFTVPDALKQFTDTEDWRKANQLNKLYETIDLDQYQETRSLYPQWTGRRDRRGIPVYVYELRHLTSKRMSAYSKSASSTLSAAKTDGTTPPKLLRLFALYENLARFVMPLCTALTDREHSSTPISQSNNIVDISGVGFKQFWNLRTHMQDASTLATAHYPETLDRIFIIGAPSFFPTVWGWIKKWFDPITTSKIFILSSSDLLPTLESFIEPANIPTQYGGKLDFKFGNAPNLDPAIESLLTWAGGHHCFPPGPMYWEDMRSEGNGAIRAVAVGQRGKAERKEVVCVLTPKTKAPEAVSSTARQTGPGNLTIPMKPELLRAPTAEEYVERSALEDPSSATVESTGSPESSPERETSGSLHDGEQTPKRPVLETFVTAEEGVRTLNFSADATPVVGAGEFVRPLPRQGN